MSVQEFATKHSVKLFYASIVLLFSTVIFGIVAFGHVIGGGPNKDDGKTVRPTVSQEKNTTKQSASGSGQTKSEMPREGGPDGLAQ
jgi:hypothetical protein